MSPEEERKLDHVLQEIKSIVIEKDGLYGSSWKSKGGFSAFFNLDRKFSRVENAAQEWDYDIFKACDVIPGTLDGLKDLIGYAALIITEVAEETSDGKFIVAEFLSTRKDSPLHIIPELPTGKDQDTGEEPGRGYVDQDNPPFGGTD